MAKEISTTIAANVSPLIKSADILVIAQPSDMETATDMLSKLNKFSDQIEAEKNKVMRPLLDAVAAERRRWKPIELPLGEAISIIRKKMSAYQTEQKKIADKEADKIADRVGSGKGKLTAATAARKMGEIDRPADTVATDAGLVKFRTVRKFTVVDLAKLPIEYHLANETAIRDALKKGTELPGVEYFDEEVPVNMR